MIRHNLFYKLFAVAVAVVLWFYVNSELNPQARKTVNVPVGVENLAKGYTAELATREATVTISGSKSLVEAVRREDVVATVDVQGLESAGRAASGVLKIDTRISGLSEDDLKKLNVVTLPPRVKTMVEALTGKRLSVEVKYTSAPPLGYTFSEPNITPTTVRVSGKSTDVAKVKRVIVTPRINAANGPIDDYLAVTALDSSGNAVGAVTLEPDRVRLRLELIEVPATKAVIVSPNVVGEPKFPVKVNRVSVTPNQVTLQGKPSALIGVSTISTDRVSIDGASDDVTREVALRVPPGVTADRSRVRVTVFISAPE